MKVYSFIHILDVLSSLQGVSAVSHHWKKMEGFPQPLTLSHPHLAASYGNAVPVFSALLQRDSEVLSAHAWLEDGSESVQFSLQTLPGTEVLL